MNLILIFEDDFTEPDRVTLHGRRMEHLLKVNRVKKGEHLNIGMLNGPMGKGVITEITPNAIEMVVLLDHAPPAPLPLTLLLALPRPKMLKRILQSISSLGVKKIFLINTWRVEKSFWGSPLLEQNRLKTEMILGLEQAKDTLMPQIHLRRMFMPFVTEELPKIATEDNPILLTAHPGGDYPLDPTAHKEKTKDTPGAANEKKDGIRKTILAMGPEGGFIDAEVKSLEKVGFTTVHLGKRILRLETAVPYIISKLF